MKCLPFTFSVVTRNLTLPIRLIATRTSHFIDHTKCMVSQFSTLIVMETGLLCSCTKKRGRYSVACCCIHCSASAVIKNTAQFLLGCSRLNEAKNNKGKGGKGGSLLQQLFFCSGKYSYMALLVFGNAVKKVSDIRKLNGKVLKLNETSKTIKVI